MTPLTKRILVHVGIFICLLLNVQLFAADRPTVQVFAPKELSEPLTKIASHDRDEKLILRPEKDLPHWMSITDAGIFIVITAHAKTSFVSINLVREKVLVQKDDTVYTMGFAMSGISIPPDNTASNAAFAYLLSSEVEGIFHTYGYEPVRYAEWPPRTDLIAIGKTTENDDWILNKIFKDKIPFVVEAPTPSVPCVIEVRRSDEKQARALLVKYQAQHPEAKKLFQLIE